MVHHWRAHDEQLAEGIVTGLCADAGVRDRPRDGRSLPGPASDGYAKAVRHDPDASSSDGPVLVRARAARPAVVADR